MTSNSQPFSRNKSTHLRSQSTLRDSLLAKESLTWRWKTTMCSILSSTSSSRMPSEARIWSRLEKLLNSLIWIRGSVLKTLDLWCGLDSKLQHLLINLESLLSLTTSTSSCQLCLAWTELMRSMTETESMLKPRSSKNSSQRALLPNGETRRPTLSEKYCLTKHHWLIPSAMMER